MWLKMLEFLQKKIVEFFAATDYKTEKVAATPNINDSEEKKKRRNFCRHLRKKWEKLQKITTYPKNLVECCW